MTDDAQTGCIFCDIASGAVEVPCIYEDDLAVAFDDINPQAPVHVLIVPKEHVVNLNDDPDEALLGHLLGLAHKLARLKGIESGGYRVIQNNGLDAGQTVSHLHIHVLGGRPLGEGLL
jgi:histidine triad (HIT) family protein